LASQTVGNSVDVSRINISTMSGDILDVKNESEACVVMRT
jgi:hypothetical protein